MSAYIALVFRLTRYVYIVCFRQGGGVRPQDESRTFRRRLAAYQEAQRQQAQMVTRLQAKVSRVGPSSRLVMLPLQIDAERLQRQMSTKPRASCGVVLAAVSAASHIPIPVLRLCLV